jgi:hypothetical protein
LLYEKDLEPVSAISFYKEAGPERPQDYLCEDDARHEPDLHPAVPDMRDHPAGTAGETPPALIVPDTGY